MTFYIKQGDTGPAILKQFIDADGAPISLATASNVKFSMKDASETVVISLAAATVFTGTLPDGSTATAADGWMKYIWQTGDTATAGTFRAEFKVTFADGSIERAPNGSYETINITPNIA